jgi:hypothetical protein
MPRGDGSDVLPTLAGSVPPDVEPSTAVHEPDEELIARSRKPVLQNPPIPREDPEDPRLPDDPIVEVVSFEEDNNEIPDPYEFEDEGDMAVTVARP